MRTGHSRGGGRQSHTVTDHMVHTCWCGRVDVYIKLSKATYLKLLLLLLLYLLQRDFLPVKRIMVQVLHYPGC